MRSDRVPSEHISTEIVKVRWLDIRRQFEERCARALYAVGPANDSAATPGDGVMIGNARGDGRQGPENGESFAICRIENVRLDEAFRHDTSWVSLSWVTTILSVDAPPVVRYGGSVLTG